MRTIALAALVWVSCCASVAFAYDGYWGASNNPYIEYVMLTRSHPDLNGEDPRATDRDIIIKIGPKGCAKRGGACWVFEFKKVRHYNHQVEGPRPPDFEVRDVLYYANGALIIDKLSIRFADNGRSLLVKSSKLGWTARLLHNVFVR